MRQGYNMGLPYIKTDIIGVDLYRLACKDQVSFTCYWLLVSHCFEHAIVSIPLDILDEKLCDITDNVDNVLKVLKLRSLITYDDNNCIVLNGIKERILNGIEAIENKTNRNKRYYEKNKVKNIEDSKDSTDIEIKNDYRTIVQQWNKHFPMSEIQYKTSYARFKSSNSWDHETVLNAIEFISNNPGIKNKIMCDWFEAGFFLQGYEFDLNTINEYFSKKGNNGKKIDTRDPTGLNTPYLEQGHKPEKFKSINLSAIKAQALSEQEIELAKQLDKVL